MDKPTALITLITHSLSLTGEQKQELFSKIPELTEDQIDLLGRYFVAERQFVLTNEQAILNEAADLINSLTAA